MRRSGAFFSSKIIIKVTNQEETPFNLYFIVECLLLVHHRLRRE